MSSTHPIPQPFNPQPDDRLPESGPAFVRFVSARFERLEQHLGRLVDRLTPKDRAWRKITTGTTDASGNLRLEVLTVPEGYELFLHRLYVNDGSTWASPTTGGGVSVQVDGQEEDGTSLVTGGLPQVFTASSSAAIVYSSGELIEVVLEAVTATKGITCIARGRLIRSRFGTDEP